MKSVENYHTAIQIDKFPADKLKYLDVEHLQRDHIIIRWSKMDDSIYTIIRDMLKCMYKLQYKWLQPDDSSYEYVAQKTNTNGDTTSIKTADVLIEPLNNDYKSLISHIPINQKLEIGTVVEIDKAIGYDMDKKTGKIPDRKFLHSGNLEFKTKLPDPIINYWHIGSMEIGSIIRAKFKVAYADLNKARCFRLFGFRRNDKSSVFVLFIWKFFGLTMNELLMLMLDYVENKYVEPEFYSIGVNDYGANILNREALAKFIRELISRVEKAGEFKNITMPKLVELESK